MVSDFLTQPRGPIILAMMSRLSRFLVVGVVTAFAVWCALSLRADFAQMSFLPLWRSWNLALLAMTLTFFNYALRIARWRWYLKRLGHRVPGGFAALTYVAGFAFTLSPGKLGELVRARYYTAIGVPARDVMAAFWAERLMDLVALLLLALLALREFPRYQALVWASGGVVALGAVVLLLFPSERIAHFFKSSPRLPKLIAHGAARAVTSFGVARSLLSPRPILVGLLVALAAWGLEGLGLGVLGSIFSPVHNDAPTAVGIYAVAVLVGAVSFLPGGVGGTETVMTALLVSEGASLVPALLTTLACRITTLWLGVCLGWLAVALLRYGPQYERSAWPSEP